MWGFCLPHLFRRNSVHKNFKAFSLTAKPQNQAVSHTWSLAVWSLSHGWLRQEGTSGGPLVKPCAQTASAGYSGVSPVGFWVSSRVEIPQPLWAASASVWSPSQCGSLFLNLDGISWILVCVQKGDEVSRFLIGDMVIWIFYSPWLPVANWCPNF